MAKKTLAEILSRFHHMGVIVENADESAKFFENLGFETFTRSKLIHYDRKVHGKPVDGVKMKANVTRLGPIGFEVIEPVVGSSIQREWLKNRGQTINHICFIVDDIDEATSVMLDSGFSVISSGKNEGGGGMAYFVHENMDGVQIELDELPPHLSGDRYWGYKPWEK